MSQDQLPRIKVIENAVAGQYTDGHFDHTPAKSRRLHKEDFSEAF
jgi:hypothetical protein